MRDLIVMVLVMGLVLSFVCADTGIAANQGANTHRYNGTNSMTAHSGSEISFTPVSGIVATNVQSAIAEVKGDIPTVITPGSVLLDSVEITAGTTTISLASTATFSSYKGFKIYVVSCNDTATDEFKIKVGAGSVGLMGLLEVSMWDNLTTHTVSLVQTAPDIGVPTARIGLSAGRDSGTADLYSNLTEITVRNDSYRTTVISNSSFLAYPTNSFYVVNGTAKFDCAVTELTLTFETAVTRGTVLVYGLK